MHHSVAFQAIQITVTTLATKKYGVLPNRVKRIQWYRSMLLLPEKSWNGMNLFLGGEIVKQRRR